MTDLKLKRLTGRHWQKFDTLDITFPEKGLVLIQGINTASGGALASVGSGKSGIGEALCRTLLGVPGRFETAKEYSTDEAGDMYLRLEADLLGKPLVVETGYKCAELSRTGDALRYTYDGTEVQRGLIKQTREDLARLLGVPTLLASWTVFIDGDAVKFNRLSQADCVELVMSALRQPPWSAYFETSKAKLGEFNRDMANHLSNHASAQQTCAAAKEAFEDAVAAAARAKAAYATAKATHDTQVNEIKQKLKNQRLLIKTKQQRMQAIKLELKKLEEARAEANHQFEIKIHTLEDKITAQEQRNQPLSDKRDELWDAVTKAKTEYDNYKAATDNCPTCQRPLGQLDPQHLERLRLKHEQAQKAYQQGKAALKTADDLLSGLRDDLKEMSRQHRDASAKQTATDLSDEYEELEGGIKATNDRIQDLQMDLADQAAGPSDKALVEANTLARTSAEYHEKQADRVAELAAIIVEDQLMQKVMTYWNKAFSPYGIPNMVLREVLGPLNAEARRISASLTGGTIGIRFSTVRDLASGQEKAQLNIAVDNKLGAKRLAGSSKGEGGLTNFIISETLSAIGQVSQRIGFRFYDEIVPQQDPKVCQSIYAHMKEVASRLNTLVFLVDHNPVAANYADHFLVVRKEGSLANCRSTAAWRT